MYEKWAQIQSILEKSLATGQMKAWIAPLRPLWEEDGLTLCAQTEFAASHIRAWYGAHIRQAVREACGPEVPVRIQTRAGEPAVLPAARGTDSVAGDAPPHPAQPLLFRKSEASAPLAERRASVLPAPRPLPPVQLALPFAASRQKEKGPDDHWRHSFEDFVVGPSNELAHAASKSICGNIGQVDLLFLSSAPGLGKTHLMQAVGKALSSVCNKSRPQVEYLTAEEFASQFYFSLKGQDTDRFKSRFRSLDLLLLEDVHFLQGKEKMQAELLATVKALRERGARLVFSSSFAPCDMKQMDEQLMSRFSAGLLSCIERPDEETRRRILRSKASLHQVLLPDEVEDMLARYIHADIRRIESCLHNLILKARLLNSRITPEMAWEVIAQYGGHAPVLDLDAIIAQVCRCFSLSFEHLSSASRKQGYVAARNTAYYLARKHTDLSLEAIGRRFNRRHSTVLKGITNLEREMSRQSPTGRQIANMVSMIEKTGNIAVLR